MRGPYKEPSLEDLKLRDLPVENVILDLHMDKGNSSKANSNTTSI